MHRLRKTLGHIVTGTGFAKQTVAVSFIHRTLHSLLTLRRGLIAVSGVRGAITRCCGVGITSLLSGHQSHSITHPHRVTVTLTGRLAGRDLPRVNSTFNNHSRAAILRTYHGVRRLHRRDRSVGRSFSGLVEALSSWACRVCHEA